MTHIKEWKLNQILADANALFVESDNGIVRETEKAVLLSLTVGYCSSLVRTINVWVPKSAILSDEEFAAERAAEQKRFDDGCARYEALVRFAKENGVKGVRSGMKKDTIMKKIADAGLIYVA